MGAAAALSLAGCTRKDKAVSPSSTAGSTVSEEPSMFTAVATEAEFESYLQQHGLAAVASLPLISGISYNGGLRYDDDPSAHTATSYIRQVAARTEDFEKKTQPGTLPIFTLVGIGTTTSKQAGATTDLLLKYLTGTVGLNPDRLRATTTDHSSSFFPQLARYGITDKQITLRPWEEAVKDGSGSGFFAPSGHPGNPRTPSFSIEYVLSDGTALEIAEITYGDGSKATAGGIGVERVSMARNDQVTTWEASLPAFRTAVKKAAAAGGAALPAGYFAQLGEKKA